MLIVSGLMTSCCPLGEVLSEIDEERSKYFYSLDDKERFIEETRLDEFDNHTVIPVKIKTYFFPTTKHDVAFFFPVYFVSNAEEFNSIRKYPDQKFLLINDIDLSSIDNFEPIGTKEEPFSGEVTSTSINDVYINDYTVEGYEDGPFTSE